MTSSPKQRLQLARAYLAERAARDPKLTPSRTYVNAATTGYYTGNRMQSARADADQHFQFSSRDQTAPQINRNSVTQQA